MSDVATELSLRGQRPYLTTSVEDTAEQDVRENWYFWSKRTATRNDHYASESITTVYAVKAAVGQKRRKGRSLNNVCLCLYFIVGDK